MGWGYIFQHPPPYFRVYFFAIISRGDSSRAPPLIEKGEPHEKAPTLSHSGISGLREIGRLIGNWEKYFCFSQLLLRVKVNRQSCLFLDLTKIYEENSGWFKWIFNSRVHFRGLDGKMSSFYTAMWVRGATWNMKIGVGVPTMDHHTLGSTLGWMFMRMNLGYKVILGM